MGLDTLECGGMALEGVYALGLSLGAGHGGTGASDGLHFDRLGRLNGFAGAGRFTAILSFLSGLLLGVKVVSAKGIGRVKGAISFGISSSLGADDFDVFLIHLGQGIDGRFREEVMSGKE